jgi:hypothetical protein
MPNIAKVLREEISRTVVWMKPYSPLTDGW